MCHPACFLRVFITFRAYFGCFASKTCVSTCKRVHRPSALCTRCGLLCCACLCAIQHAFYVYSSRSVRILAVLHPKHVFPHVNMCIDIAPCVPGVGCCAVRVYVPSSMLSTCIHHVPCVFWLFCIQNMCFHM